MLPPPGCITCMSKRHRETRRPGNWFLYAERSVSSMPSGAIPRVSYRDVIADDGSTIDVGVRRFGEALRDTGFVLLKDAPFRSDLLVRNYQFMQKVFDLDTFVLERYSYPQIGYQRGYMPYGVETGFYCDEPDQKLAFCFGSFHNVAVREVSGYLEAAEEFYHACRDLGYYLMKAIVEFLDPSNREWNKVSGWFRDPDGEPIDDSHMRHIRYPGDADLPACEHFDINMLTLLPIATRSGLQIKTHEGEWVDVDPKPGDLIVNAGDMLNFISGGMIRSTLHRVINPTPSPHRDRFSMPFFYHPDHAKELRVLKSCADQPGANRRFPYEKRLGYSLLYEILNGTGQIPDDVTREDFIANYEHLRKYGLPASSR
ncbi:hypothetical protein GF324_10715 [bacterium]|nr:hypothetical protein [bacterium]